MLCCRRVHSCTAWRAEGVFVNGVLGEGVFGGCLRVSAVVYRKSAGPWQLLPPEVAFF